MTAQGPEENFFLTISTPLLIYGGEKLLDWLFEEAVAALLPPNAGTSSKVTTSREAEASTDVTRAPNISAPCPQHPGIGSARADLSVSVAYRLYRVTADNQKILVSPDTTFKNGEQIMVKFATNVPGILDIKNLDVDGEIQRLGLWFVPGGSTARLGPYAFYGTPGADLLVLRLYPCRRDTDANPLRLELYEPTPGSRSVKIRQDAIELLPSCASIEPSAGGSDPSLESLRLVEGSTGFSVSRLDPDFVDRSAIRPLVTKIRLQHR